MVGQILRVLGITISVNFSAMAVEVPPERLPSLGDALRWMWNQNYSLLEAKKRIEINKLRELASLLNPLSVQGSWRESRSRSQIEGLRSEFHNGQTSIGLRLTIRPGYFSSLAETRALRKGLENTLQDEATVQAVQLVASHLAYELSRRALVVLDDLLKIPRIVVRLAEKIDDPARRKSVRQLAESYLSEIDDAIADATFSLEDASIAFESVLPNPMPLQDNRSSTEQLTSLDTFFGPVGVTSFPNNSAIVESRIRKALQRIHRAAPPPGSAEEGLAMALLTAPGLKVQRYAVEMVEHARDRRLINLLGPQLELAYGSNNQRDRILGTQTDTAEFVASLTWRYNFGDLPRLIAANKEIELARVELERSEHEVFTDMKRLLSVLKRDTRQLNLSIESHREAFLSIQQIRSKIDENSPNPDLLRDLIDLHRVGLQERLSLESDFGSIYLTHFHIYALIEPLPQLIDRVGKMGPDYF